MNENFGADGKQPDKVDTGETMRTTEKQNSKRPRSKEMKQGGKWESKIDKCQRHQPQKVSRAIVNQDRKLNGKLEGKLRRDKNERNQISENQYGGITSPRQGRTNSKRERRQPGRRQSSLHCTLKTK